MTIRDLIDELEDLAEEHGDETEVRLAIQPNWPFEHSIREIVAVSPADAADEDEDEPGDDAEAEPIVYIGEGSQIGYLPGLASRALGWGRR